MLRSQVAVQEWTAVSFAFAPGAARSGVRCQALIELAETPCHHPCSTLRPLLPPSLSRASSPRTHKDGQANVLLWQVGKGTGARSNLGGAARGSAACTPASTPYVGHPGVAALPLAAPAGCCSPLSSLAAASRNCSRSMSSRCALGHGGAREGGGCRPARARSHRYCQAPRSERGCARLHGVP